MKKQTFLALALFISLSFFVKAQTGYLGGDITWTCIGSDSFIIKMVLYKDCNQAAMPDSIQMPIKCKSTGTLIQNLTIMKPPPVDITPTCGATSTRCQDPNSTFPYGIEQYTYSKLIVIPSSVSCCEISMSYTACCRSKAFTNIQGNSPFHLEAWLNRCISPCDNSPSFTNPPIAIICKDQDFVFCHGVVDIDVGGSGGLLDSLSYEWVAPKISSTAIVTYNSPFTFDKSMYFWGYPNEKLPFPRGFHLDQICGGIQFRPDSFGFSSMAEKVTEFRNGQKIIGETTREIAIIVIQCPKNNAPVLAGPYYKETCATSTVHFSIHTNDYDSKDTLLISWNGSISGALWNDNNKVVKHPTGTLSWTPAKEDASDIPYVFTVTVKDDACPVNGSATRAYQILVKPLPEAEHTKIDSGGGLYYFHAKTIVGKNPSYTWVGNFNPGFVFAGPSMHYKFDKPGKYPYTLQVETQQCQRIYFDTLVYDTNVSISPVKAKKLVVYPNPAGEQILLKFENPEVIRAISVFNSLGETVLQKSKTNLPYLLDISSLNTGVYILQLDTQTEKYWKRILIK
ncbi:MAG: T9SS type A sorting domain-containing protein [Bacteroidetes bacterium]|nr:T9SS type A sorting domain-containing protein [Bacteroidota bacterium]MBT5529527.1 T9SS type A sorting domain-containing protein [Cytophagia bacterium]MBT3802581.1 T9SS type A sorting domain-containing protein [Bacteroidota bacterium]MBT4340342.1 T9SS type A sorting domain-containing protein [Bacteroidota bacterium]MBT4729840.1 T9SS type A sorting domain-containing protein [Bacteroidota bacterium]